MPDMTCWTDALFDRYEADYCSVLGSGMTIPVGCQGAETLPPSKSLLQFGQNRTDAMSLDGGPFPSLNS